jgi:hypothetical protein
MRISRIPVLRLSRVARKQRYGERERGDGERERGDGERERVCVIRADKKKEYNRGRYMRV